MLPHKPHDDLLSILSRILGSAPITRHHSWGRGGRGRWWQGPGGSAQDTTLASLDDCVGVVWGCPACIFHPYWYQHPNFASGNHPDPILSPCSWIKTNLALRPKDGHLTQARESAYSTLLAIRDLGSTPGLAGATGKVAPSSHCQGRNGSRKPGAAEGTEGPRRACPKPTPARQTAEMGAERRDRFQPSVEPSWRLSKLDYSGLGAN